MKIARKLIEDLSRAEIAQAKKELSKDVLSMKAARYWDEGVQYSKAGKHGYARFEFETAESLAPTKKEVKEYSKWREASEAAHTGKGSVAIDKLLATLKSK